MQHKKYLPNVIAASWGLAEATFFFIVPDVFISYRALHSQKSALTASLYSLAGALVGGSVMYFWALHTTTALHFVQHVPAITQHMFIIANADYVHAGMLALLIAPLRAIPYKLYTVVGVAHGINFLPFIILSAIARLSRFVAVSLVASALVRLLKPRLNAKQLFNVWLGFWLLFYAIYFYVNRH